MVVESALAVIIGYLLGSIPFAYIAARLVKRVDIRKVGGGNIGALNVMREIGTAAGIGVLIADIAKGAIAVLIAQWLGLSLEVTFIAGFAAVVGHSWPIFLKFSGGRGGATTLGVLSALAPIAFAISFGVIVIIVLVTSNFRLAMGVGFVLMPFIIWGFGGELSLIVYSVALPFFTGLRAAPVIIRSLTSAEDRKSLIIDKKHTWWQRKRK